MSSSFNIAFLADSHLGYRAKVRSNDQGINLRVQDGYDAFRETFDQILTSDVKIDAVIHGGDLFHNSQPSMRDIVIAQFYLRELAKRGIPFYGVAGNHDVNDIKANLAAVATVDDPDRKIFALYKPYSQYNLTDGIVLHAMSHHGLSTEEAPQIKPVAGMLNLFTTHGAALDPKNNTLMRCIDSPREQIVPVDLIIDDDFIVKLLGHYHSRYAVGDSSLNTWYAGSSIRRGFSDAPGDRGWLLVKIFDNGQPPVVEAKNISQRPQFDLDVIDAVDLSSSAVMERLEINLNRTKEVDVEPIVRQRIINANRSLREGLDKDRINELTKHMLSWQLEFIKPEYKESDGNVSTKNEMSLSSSHSINVVDSYKRWVEDESKKIPEAYREVVITDAETYLKTARDLSLLEDGGHSH